MNKQKNLLREYIKLIAHVDNDMASHVLIKDGYAFFWHQDDGYVLVIENDPTYWGDEELVEFNEIRLTEDELYTKLHSLPDANTTNFYGMRSVINKLMDE